MRLTSSILMLAAACALGGCGVSESSHTSSGSKLFAYNCALCHSLIGSESLHRQGGDLLSYRFSRQALDQYTRQMPARQPLNHAQLTAIVDYVSAAEQRGRGG